LDPGGLVEEGCGVNEERWQALVRRLEPLARANPSAYRRKVVLLAALGYAYIATLLLLLVAGAGLVVYLAIIGPLILLKLLIPIAALVWVVGRSLWVTFTPPDGVRLKRGDVPELFRMLDEVRATVRGPKLHQVLVDDDANAGIVQVPRLGGLAGSRNYLVLGLPYMQALSPEQFRAVIGHELGHLSRAHGRFGAFVYRVRGTWFQLLEGLMARKSLMTGLVSRFFAWYVPYFDAYTFPIQRAHEFEADDAGAEAAGKEATASSLVAGMLAARWLHEVYWPRVYERAADEPAPPQTAFAPLAHELPSARDGEGAERWFRELLELETDVTDSHPSPAERIAHLGLDPQEVFRAATTTPERTAADAYLGAAEPAVVAAVERAWSKGIAEAWREQHAEAQRAKLELQRLDERAAKGELEPDDALTRAHLTESFRSEDEALERYRELVGTENDAPARYGVGKLLLQKGDEEGLEWVDQAMERDPDAVLPATQLAYDWLRERGREDEAERYRTRAEQQVEVLEAAEEERSQVTVDDELAPPALAPELVEQIRRKVSWHEEVGEAYLVRKRTEHLDEEHPFHVVALVPKHGFRTAWREADDDAEPLEERVARDLQFGDDLMVAKIGKKSPLAERFAEIEGARLL
jgi:Zn-dependent protease with chaperone function